VCDWDNDIHCEKQEVAWKLEGLINQETITLTNGETLIRVGKIKQLIKELECSI
jgi:hypothetical protein